MESVWAAYKLQCTHSILLIANLQGASLAAIVELAQCNNYVLVETTLFNAFLVRNVCFDTCLADEVPDTSIEALHDCKSMSTTIYQLYDGTLKLWGCKKLLWHRLPIDETKIQILADEQRCFPFAPPNNAHDSKFDSSNVVDLSCYCQPQRLALESPAAMNAHRNACAKSLMKQLQETGFCLVQGTGLSKSICQDALDATQSFLQDADEAVRRSCLASDRARRGYSPKNTENFASLIGDHAPNDLVRKFRVGSTSEASGTTFHALLQPNIWPSASHWEQAAFFQESVEAYFKAICTASKGMLHAICDSLLQARPELGNSIAPLASNVNVNNETEGIVPEMSSMLTLLGYQIGTRHKGKNKGPLVAAHTDVGIITILLFDGKDTCATLQRSDGHGGWMNVELPHQLPHNPIFVINIADCLSELSQGRVPSTVHRVVANRSGSAPRNCCALFVGLDPNAKIQAGSNVLTYAEWRRLRIEKATSILKGIPE
jgi:isopenicillin N synthase-like dioxygenase